MENELTRVSLMKTLKVLTDIIKRKGITRFEWWFREKVRFEKKVEFFGKKGMLGGKGCIWDCTLKNLRVN